MTRTQINKVRAGLEARGINLREHCEQLGISYQAARDLLSGRGRARRGERHRAAVALGLKPDPSTLKLAA
jgi:gp16 family phage-associated protein